MLILFIFLLVRYRERTAQDKYFRNLVFFTMVTDLLDVMLVYMTNNHIGSPGLMIMLNTVDHITSICSAYSFLQYAYAYVNFKAENTARRILTGLNQLILVGCLIAFLQNLITGNILWVDSDWTYTEGPLFILFSYAVPGYYILYAGVTMQQGLIMTMANMVENRDSDTGAHIQKTAAYHRTEFDRGNTCLHSIADDRTERLSYDLLRIGSGNVHSLCFP